MVANKTQAYRDQEACLVSVWQALDSTYPMQVMNRWILIPLNMKEKSLAALDYSAKRAHC